RCGRAAAARETPARRARRSVPAARPLAALRRRRRRLRLPAVLPRAAYLAGSHVRAAEVPHAARGGARARGRPRAPARSGPRQPDVAGTSRAQAVVLRRDAAALERAPRRLQPRRAATVAAGARRTAAGGRADVPRRGCSRPDGPRAVEQGLQAPV